MPRKVKTRKAINIPLNTFRNVLRASRRPWVTISNHRKLIPANNYSEMREIIESHPKAGPLLSSFLLPQKLNLIHALPPLPKISLVAELRWAVATLVENAGALSNFLVLKQKLNLELAHKKFDQALTTLEEIDSKVCKSIWSETNKISAFQKTGGLDANKTYATKLIEDANKVGIFAYIIEAISSRNEEAININWLHDNYFYQIDSWSIPSDLKDYLHYNLYRSLCSFTDYSSLLRYSNVSSLIDLYETFIFTVANLTSSTAVPKDILLYLVKQVSNATDDFRLRKIEYGLTGNEEYLKEFVSLPAFSFDLVRSKEVQNPHESFVPNLDTIGHIHYLINQAKCYLDLDKQPNDPEVLNFWKVMRKQPGFYDYYHQVKKSSLNGAPPEHEFIVKNFLAIEFCSKPFQISQKLDFLEFVYSNYLAPTHILCLPEEGVKKSYSAFLEKIYGGSVISRSLNTLYSKIHEEQDLTGDKPEYRLISLIEQLFDSDQVEAINYAKKLCNSSILRMRRYGGRYYSYFLEQAGDYKTLLEFAGNSLVVDNGTQFTLPLEDLGSLLTKEKRREFADLIDVSIVLSFITNQQENDDDRRLIYAYEDFIRTAGVEKPSELKIKKDNINVLKYVYFLRNICTPLVISNSIIFESDSEVEDERLKICNVLSILDAENTEIYKEEAESILKKQAIRAVLRHVEKSKIYVDIDNIRVWAHKNLNTNYNRYLSFLKARVGINTDTTDPALDIEIKEKTVSSPDNIILHDPRNEAYDVLVEIIIKLLAEFFHNSMYGLDSQLSVRIRHGWISAQLREPFSKYQIITQKVSDSEKYETNEKWINASKHLGNEHSSSLDKCLNLFSRDIDNFIEKVSKNYIQIHSKSHPDGLIYTGLPTSIVRALMSEIKPDETFDAFLDRIFSILWTLTGASLEKIRTFIRTIVSEELIKIVENLEAEVRRLNEDNSLNLLEANISFAKVDIQQAITGFEEWFVISEGLKHDPVSIEDIINAALTSVMKGHSEGVNPKITFLSKQKIVVKDQDISTFNDVSFIILENILKHSGISGDIDIQVLVGVNDKTIDVEIKNPISNTIDLRKVNKTLENIRSSIETKTHLEKMNQEGQTGLRKLTQLLESLGINNGKTLEFGVHNKKEFFVKFKLNVSWQHEEDINYRR